MATQCYGVASALAAVHQDQAQEDGRQDEDVTPQSSTGHGGQLPKLYGRHGDIKPKNILCFIVPAESGGKLADIRLVLADFGLGGYNRQTSRSNIDPMNIQTSPSYRPPEKDLKKRSISRKIDIWGLGCTFLEFVTWYLKGWIAVDRDFPEMRAENDIYDVNSDIFFRIDKENDTPYVKRQVTEWIRTLREDAACTNYLHDFLDIIEGKLLRAWQKDRITCAELEIELAALMDKYPDTDSCRRLKPAAEQLELSNETN
jgi:serine/threonine protein kinase